MYHALHLKFLKSCFVSFLFAGGVGFKLVDIKNGNKKINNSIHHSLFNLLILFTIRFCFSDSLV